MVEMGDIGEIFRVRRDKTGVEHRAEAFVKGTLLDDAWPGVIGQEQESDPAAPRLRGGGHAADIAAFIAEFLIGKTRPQDRRAHGFFIAANPGFQRRDRHDAVAFDADAIAGDKAVGRIKGGAGIARRIEAVGQAERCRGELRQEQPQLAIGQVDQVRQIVEVADIGRIDHRAGRRDIFKGRMAKAAGLFNDDDDDQPGRSFRQQLIFDDPVQVAAIFGQREIDDAERFAEGRQPLLHPRCGNARATARRAEQHDIDRCRILMDAFIDPAQPVLDGLFQRRPALIRLVGQRRGQRGGKQGHAEHDQHAAPPGDCGHLCRPRQKLK